MALLFRDDDGTGTFFPDQVRGDIVTISELDAGVGEDPARADGMIPITYTRTPSFTDEPPIRLDDLCNQAFNGPSPLPSGVPAPPNTPIDFHIWAVGGNFTTPDGILITTAAGVAYRWDLSGNPTGHLLCIYDASQCNGSGYWVRNLDGDPINEPPSVILYHELAHLHDFATTGDSTEPSAENQENDLRDFLGLPHRDPDSHEGGCGGGPSTCCVVASLATDSPFSDEVKALRRVRDRLLRRSEVGYELFASLHKAYYRFSSRVCTLMASSKAIRGLVRSAFVHPLVSMLELLWSRTDPATDLGREFRRRVVEQPLLSQLDEAQRQQALRIIVEGDGIEEHAGTYALAQTLRDHAMSDPVVRWALLGPIEALLYGLGLLQAGLDDDALGQTLSKRLDAWAAEMPLLPIWKQLSPSERRRELGQLESVLLLTENARARFSERLDQFLSEAA